ncbi:hypothetical protein AT05_07080 [Schleiferia thermophila str. Yellowstone]|nr:hypothetical protein AT05_07080 [Schleiferia thermophila str. Yellowstone]
MREALGRRKHRKIFNKAGKRKAADRRLPGKDRQIGCGKGRVHMGEAKRPGGSIRKKPRR